MGADEKGQGQPGDAASREANPDVVLVGAGIMSATLAAMLKELQPDLEIEIYEALEGPAEESSNSWNNAGTGHAALMELNYTPQREDGSVDISKALEVNTEFDLSRQFWSYLVRTGAIKDPRSFIHPVPHMSFVRGAEDIAFLKKRFAALAAHPNYRGMEFSDDRKEVEEWIPLVMEGRADDDAVAVTRMITGSDVDYGSLTRQLIEYVSELGGCTVHYSTPVTDIHRTNCGTWRLTVLDDAKHKHRDVETDFVFLGAGGGALPLLQKSGIPEGKGYGGFPVSGIWLRCDNEELADRHDAKVYGKAASGSPPMSVPHLDKRVIDGKRALLFGPYAGTSPKFLKHGSHLALFKSVKWDNIVPMMAAGADNVSLVKYLAGQVVQSEGHRFDVLRGYFPEADPNDWILQVAGQRVQIIEHGQAGEKRGLLKFGTELVKSDDGSLVTLLGASPGASTAVWVILEVIKHCFPARVQGAWGRRLAELVPSFGKSLIDDTDLCQRVRAETSETLQLKNID